MNMYFRARDVCRESDSTAASRLTEAKHVMGLVGRHGALMSTEVPTIPSLRPALVLRVINAPGSCSLVLRLTLHLPGSQEQGSQLQVSKHTAG